MNRSKKGQSLVEYALGIGCVAACCMLALGTIGHISGEIFEAVLGGYNYAGSMPSHNQSIVNRGTATPPWNIEAHGGIN